MTQSPTLLTNVVARNREFRLRFRFPIFLDWNLFRDLCSRDFWLRWHRWWRRRRRRRTDVWNRETSDKARRPTRLGFVIDVGVDFADVVVEVKAASGKGRGSTEKCAPVFRKRRPVQDVQDLGAVRPQSGFRAPAPDDQVPQSSLRFRKSEAVRKFWSLVVLDADADLFS